YGLVGVKYENGSKRIVMVHTKEGNPEEVGHVSLTQKTVYLKAECDFINKRDTAYFYYSLDEKNWKKIGLPLKMTYTLPHFMSYRFGLFNYSTEQTGGYVYFDYFRITRIVTEKN